MPVRTSNVAAVNRLSYIYVNAARIRVTEASEASLFGRSSLRKTPRSFRAIALLVCRLSLAGRGQNPCARQALSLGQDCSLLRTHASTRPPRAPLELSQKPAKTQIQTRAAGLHVALLHSPRPRQLHDPKAQLQYARRGACVEPASPPIPHGARLAAAFPPRARRGNPNAAAATTRSLVGARAAVDDVDDADVASPAARGLTCC